MNVLKAAFLNLLEQVIFVLRPEWVVSLQHHKQKHSQTPHICINWHVVSLRYDLGRHVGRGPAEGVDCAGGH